REGGAGGGGTRVAGLVGSRRPARSHGVNQSGGGAAPTPGIRGGEGELRGGAGHPPRHPARGPPRDRPHPEQPGGGPAPTGGFRGGEGELRGGAGHPPRRPARN